MMDLQNFMPENWHGRFKFPLTCGQKLWNDFGGVGFRAKFGLLRN